MDTICCPVAPPETRSKVVSQMRDIYTGADQVVVIDAWLAGTKEQASPRTVAEVCMRIVVSDWNSRLKTLQEGALAQRLQVAFGSSLVDLSMEYFADARRDAQTERHGPSQERKRGRDLSLNL
jgi:hypothetical protein